MSIRFYNTLTNRVEDFKEIEKGKVGLYTCGPTVYDTAHIGNFRSFAFEDLVKRYFIYRGYDVYHVMNLTDVDDRTIKKANDQKTALSDITEKYTGIFFKDLEILNIVKADVYPKATEHVEEMVGIIQKLMEKGFAYQKGDSVYFSIESFKDYGKLANIQKENLKMGTSVDSDNYDKNNIQDFVLWKGKKENEPFWETTFGNGRPGWHIECSAMSMKYLGEHFDIHMGGVDNIFPHHENEIAQSVCATGEKFVNYWIHCQHLVMDFQKMSKSLGNFFTLQDLVKKKIQPMAIRYLLISTHYRKLLNFTFDNLSQATQSLKRIQDFIFTIKGIKPEPGISEKIPPLIEENEALFVSHMDDDFNISGAIGVFFEFIHQIHLQLNDLKQDDIDNILAYVNRINSVLGIIEDRSEDTLDSEIQKKIQEREAARKEKNYQLADQIRDQLLADGIILIDTPDGVRWKKNPKP